MSFSDKVAIVTGAAAGGIGEGIALAMAKEGAKVVVADINEAGGAKTVEALKRAGGDATFCYLDIASPESAARMAENAVKAYGKINFLVNNAALFGGMPQEGLMNIEWALLQKVVNLNALGGLCVTRSVVPHMKKQSGGAIVNMSSSAAYFGAGHYSLCKMAVNGVTFSLARELGPSKIRVNAVAPGPIETPALHQGTSQQILDAIVPRLPIPRMGSPGDIANTVVFLLSDKASWITGSIFNVDGGQLVRM